MEFAVVHFGVAPICMEAAGRCPEQKQLIIFESWNSVTEYLSAVWLGFYNDPAGFRCLGLFS